MFSIHYFVFIHLSSATLWPNFCNFFFSLIWNNHFYTLAIFENHRNSCFYLWPKKNKFGSYFPFIWLYVYSSNQTTSAIMFFTFFFNFCLYLAGLTRFNNFDNFHNTFLNLTILSYNSYPEICQDLIIQTKIKSFLISYNYFIGFIVEIQKDFPKALRENGALRDNSQINLHDQLLISLDYQLFAEEI